MIGTAISAEPKKSEALTKVMVRLAAGAARARPVYFARDSPIFV